MNYRDKLILSIDAGTQSIRAMLFDLDGNPVEKVKTPIEPYFSERPGWAEQDPEYYWKILCETTRKLLHGTSVPRGGIAGVTLTTQRGTVINVDKKGNPLRPAITWLDQRKAAVENWPSGLLRTVMRAAGVLDPVEYVIKESEANWIRQNQPEIWKNTYKYLLLSGFFFHRLTGKFIESTGGNVGYLPFDYKKQRWLSDGNIKWKIFPMDREMLPELHAPSEVVGKITAKASEKTGIPAGLPVVTAASDKACEMLGSGCLTPDIACLSYGTTATVETTTQKYVEIIPMFPPYPSAVPGAYNTEVQIFRGFWMVSWFRKEFGLKEELLASEREVEPEELFDEMIKSVPPGSMGLVLQPYWMAGVRVPGPEAKGAIIGFGDVHTRAHVYRAILEGLAYALKEGLMRTEKKNGVRVKELRISGGGSQSEVAMQITADVFNLPAHRPHTYETSALGAAINAAVGLGLHPDFKTAVARMTHTGTTFNPIPENAVIYSELFENVYMKMYPGLRDIYKNIRKITGYPAF